MPDQNSFTFIDLFAGIGGFHIAMHNLGGTCVFASEMDTHARTTYEHNFKKLSPELFDNGMFNDDIRNIAPDDIPDFDVLCAGFPCQPFSQAGYKRGFSDNHSSERGNLFFNIAEIIDAKRPRAIFLENVRGLVNHDGGKTFKVIRNIIEEELGYSFYYKVVKATDYGLPQHRPRAFMVGFRDEGFMRAFTFPPTVPLKFNMSDVWGGECSREIGFTLRVGGRGSKIHDRRNWDAYLVDGEVKTLSHIEGRKMQGFPDGYEFPVSATQAIKQLGNSVAIDAVQAVGKQMLRYMNELNQNNPQTMTDTNNKGEWTELLVFMKLLAEQKLDLADSNLNPTNKFFNILKVSTHNLPIEFAVVDDTTIQSIDTRTGATKKIDISSLLSSQTLLKLTQDIINGSGTFEIPGFSVIQNALGFSVVKGGNSNQKADVLLDIKNDEVQALDEGFGIKSYLGNKPTLLNASGNTNFIFLVDGLDPKEMDGINSIKSRYKLMDRLNEIEKLGGTLVYKGAERSAMEHNLSMVDSQMPIIIGHVLLSFYRDRVNSISDIVAHIDKAGVLKKEIQYKDVAVLEASVKRLLVDILLGFFAGKRWNGDHEANGTIVMKSNGTMVGFHVVDMKSLKDYLFNVVKLDTPSTTRHRFGKLYKEKDGKLYFKLNLQLRC